MARLLPFPIAKVRHLLLALLAIGLVVRMGAGCEAMAATPQAIAVHQSHCAELPAKPDRPVKAADCALCVTLPDAAASRATATTYVQIEPFAAKPVRLAGIAGGPAPPPPKIA